MRKPKINLAIMMIARIDSNSRLRNCETTLRYYSTMFNNVYFYEVDSHSRIPVEFKDNFPNVNFIFIEDGSRIFHRTLYMNHGFRNLQYKHQFIANIDVDVIVPFRQLYKSLNLIVKGRTPMVIPYNGKCISLNEDTTMSIYSSKNSIYQLNPIMGHPMFGSDSFGGAYVINVKWYKRLGWENENIIGWGPEDIERVLRLDILGHQAHQISGYIYHLNHYRGINSGDFDINIAVNTKREFCRVCNMNKAELIEYIKTWHWIN